MIRLGMGRLSLTRQDFLDITPRELMCIYEGYVDRDKEQWEKVRMISFYSAAPFQNKGFSPNKIWTPYDKPIKREKPSTAKRLDGEELKRIYDRSGLEISDKKLKEILWK